MKVWKKGLFIGLFSSMLWEQHAVAAAVGLQAQPLGVLLPDPLPERTRPDVTAVLTVQAEMERLPLQVVQHAVAEQARWASFEPEVTPDEQKRQTELSKLTAHELRELLHQIEAEEQERARVAAEQQAAARKEAERKEAAHRATLSSRGTVVVTSAAGTQSSHQQGQQSQPAGNQHVQPATGSNAAPTLMNQPGVGSPRGAQVVTMAMQYQGSPYRYGGTTPGGFDCSGFIQYVMQQAGITLPRTTYQQIGAGTPVARGALQAGDLVFFAPGGNTTGHVGLYVGNGRFLHADQTRGVVVSELNSGYWAGVYQAAVRVL